MFTHNPNLTTLCKRLAGNRGYHIVVSARALADDENSEHAQCEQVVDL